MKPPGIFFAVIADHRRSVYQQYDGQVILADECKCVVNWLKFRGAAAGISFEILRNADCPINEHQRLTLQGMQKEAEDL